MIVNINQVDIDREPLLADYCRPLVNPFTGKPDGKNWGYSMTHIGGCPFLDERTRECMIYETRPNICRLFEAGSEQCRWMRGETTLEQIRTIRDEARAAGRPLL